MREALIRQWTLLADAIPALELEAESRISGWRNREVVAHLALQPTLLARFLKTASVDRPEVTLAANLAGTAALSEIINTAARKATEPDLDFVARMTRVLPTLSAADLRDTITTMQGPIGLLDYLRTRCVEAVVHGRDLSPPVSPDEEALEIAAAALLDALQARRPDLVREARSLGALVWLDQATGRAQPSPPLVEVLPVME
ncbi:MAG TPA: maleylpyruvate isomerase N-terminal domain-containing protein [Acidimicrobiales bacterium]|nr:maleylpyruvate isomerase N-terminal domain-containing protein [Acidimicrobiales bacterium]